MIQRIRMDSEKLLLYASLSFAFAIGAFILWGPSSSRSRKRSGHVGGLVNLGYTCFLNTLLQALASCPLMLEWLTQQQGAPSNSLISALHTVLLVLNGQHSLISDDPFTPSNVIKSLLSQGWVISPGEQDAHELFHVIIATLEEESQAMHERVLSLSDALIEPIPNKLSHLSNIPREIQSDTTDVHTPPALVDGHLHVTASASASCSSSWSLKRAKNSFPPFDGLLTSQLQCTSCNYKSAVLYDKFDSLSLPLPTIRNAFLQKLTLLQLLDNFVSTEVVKDFACESCNRDQEGLNVIKSDALKTLNFGKLPKCLCIHIQRTTWQKSGQASKRFDYIEFPEFLCMDAYTYTRVQRKKATNLKLYENGDQLGQNSVCKNLLLSNLRLKHLYKLVAVVVHTGDVECGHFITYRRAPLREHSWYYTSDSEVRESSLDEAMQACAYMLFYSKCAQKSPLRLAAFN